MSKAIVTIANKFSEASPYGFTLPETGKCVQIIQVSVHTGEDEEEFLIANTYPEPFSQILFETLMENLCQSKAHQVVGVLVADGEGWIHIKTQDGEHTSCGLAAAAAVYKASLGWDESPSIVVIVNEAELSVSPRFESNQWIVESLS